MVAQVLKGNGIKKKKETRSEDKNYLILKYRIIAFANYDDALYKDNINTKFFTVQSIYQLFYTFNIFTTQIEEDLI